MIHIFSDMADLVEQVHRKHIANLKKTLEKLHTVGFCLKLQKSKHKPNILVTYNQKNRSAHMQPQKLKTIIDMLLSQSLKELCSFLRMVNYYKKLPLAWLLSVLTSIGYFCALINAI